MSHDLSSQDLILSHQDVIRKIQRLAFQIYEQNVEEDEIVLAGINGGGFVLATKLDEELRRISPITVKLCSIKINKSDLLAAKATCSIPIETLTDRTIIIVDDVLNTGKTLAYGLCPFLDFPLKKVQVAVLVDRSYHQFPISADYVGYSLSTTINQHIEARLSENEMGVYLY